MLPSEVLHSLQQLLTDRCRQEEDASGKYALLFTHIDADKNGTIEKKGTKKINLYQVRRIHSLVMICLLLIVVVELLEFLRSLAPPAAPKRPFEQVEKQVRQKILEEMGFAPPAPSSSEDGETDKR